MSHCPITQNISYFIFLCIKVLQLLSCRQLLLLCRGVTSGDSNNYSYLFPLPSPVNQPVNINSVILIPLASTNTTSITSPLCVSTVVPWRNKRIPTLRMSMKPSKDISGTAAYQMITYTPTIHRNPPHERTTPTIISSSVRPSKSHYTQLKSSIPTILISAPYSSATAAPSVYSPATATPSVYSPATATPSVNSPATATPTIKSLSTVIPTTYYPTMVTQTSYSPTIATRITYSPATAIPTIYSSITATTYSPMIATHSTYFSAIAVATTYIPTSVAPTVYSPTIFPVYSPTLSPFHEIPTPLIVPVAFMSNKPSIIHFLKPYATQTPTMTIISPITPTTSQLITPIPSHPVSRFPTSIHPQQLRTIVYPSYAPQIISSLPNKFMYSYIDIYILVFCSHTTYYRMDSSTNLGKTKLVDR